MKSKKQKQTNKRAKYKLTSTVQNKTKRLMGFKKQAVFALHDSVVS